MYSQDVIRQHGVSSCFCLCAVVAAKATVTVQDEDEDTALHNAANGNHAAVVKLLLEAGADKTLENGDGNTPAALARDDDVVSLFD